MTCSANDVDEIDYLNAFSEADRSLIFKRESIMKYVSLNTHRVSDRGCGAGHLAKELLDRHRDVVAVDLDLEALQRAKQRYSGPLIRGSALAIPFHSELFDIVVGFICFLAGAT